MGPVPQAAPHWPLNMDPAAEAPAPRGLCGPSSLPGTHNAGTSLPSARDLWLLSIISILRTSWL